MGGDFLFPGSHFTPQLVLRCTEAAVLQRRGLGVLFPAAGTHQIRAVFSSVAGVPGCSRDCLFKGAPAPPGQEAAAVPGPQGGLRRAEVTEGQAEGEGVQGSVNGTWLLPADSCLPSSLERMHWTG